MAVMLETIGKGGAAYGSAQTLSRDTATCSSERSAAKAARARPKSALLMKQSGDKASNMIILASTADRVP